MLTFRCTKKARDYFQINPQEINESSTAILNEWYLNIAPTVLGNFLLFVDAPTKLTVVVPCDAITDVGAAFCRSAIALYERLEFPDELISDEAQQIVTAIYTKTKSRSVLGCMNDIAYHVQFWAETALDIGTTIEALEESLSLVLHGPAPYKYPLETVWSQIAERYPTYDNKVKVERVTKRVWSEKEKIKPFFEDLSDDYGE